jgi:predicted regulator of Ras-like GTPase activity (Roadblock/LC7/MglB family)
VTGTRFRRLLDQLTRLRGVRGALLVAGEDGLVVAESVMEGVKGNAVAALTGSLARRMRRAADAAGVGFPQFVHLQSARGAICIAPAADGTLVVALADAEANIGMLRLALLKVAEVVV